MKKIRSSADMTVENIVVTAALAAVAFFAGAFNPDSSLVVSTMAAWAAAIVLSLLMYGRDDDRYSVIFSNVPALLGLSLALGLWSDYKEFGLDQPNGLPQFLYYGAVATVLFAFSLLSSWSLSENSDNPEPQWRRFAASLPLGAGIVIGALLQLPFWRWRERQTA